MTEKTTFTVVPLTPKELKPDPEVIERIEFLLAEAKAGRMSGIAVAFLDEKYAATWMKVGIQSCSTMGALEILIQYIGKGIRDGAETLK